MKRPLLLCILFIVILAFPLLHTAEAAEPSDRGTTRQEILILNSYHPGYAWSDEEQAGIIDVFRAKDKKWLPVIEYLDLKRLPDGRHLAELKKFFLHKYQNQKFSVVIAMDNPALEFAMDNQAALFQNAPIVFCGINNYPPSLLRGRSDVTGIAEAIDIPGTIDVMLRLHPATQEIFSPHDYTATGLAVRKELESLIPRFGARVRFRFTDPLTMEELLKEVERLPKNSLLLEIGFITDKSGRTFDISETTKLFSEHSPVPIYSTYEQRLGFGIVGGKLLSPRIHGANAARTALRVLAGEKASAIPVVFESDSKFMFDYKVMSRFEIPLSALPEGSKVINQPFSLLDKYWPHLLAIIGVFIVLCGVVAYLLLEIRKRKQTEQALRESEERFRALTVHAPAGIYLTDPEGNCLYTNPRWNEMAGLNHRESLGEGWIKGLHPVNRATVYSEWKKMVESEGHWGLEYRFQTPEGKVTWVYGLATPLRDASGKIFQYVGVNTDITDRKQAEEVLRLSEEQYRIVADNTYDWEFWLNPEGRFNYVSPSCMRITGYDIQDFMSDPELIFRIVHPEDRPVFEQHHLEADKQMKPGEVEFRIIRKDGELRWIAHTCMPVYGIDGQFLGIRGSNRDITARKKAEMAIQESWELFFKAFRNAPILMTISSVEDGAYIDVNEKFIEVSGFSRDEAVGKTSIELGWISAEDRKRIIDALTPSGYVENMEIDLFNKYNKKIQCLYSGQYVMVHGIKRILSIAVDITDRKRAENSLQLANIYNRGLIEASLDPLVTISPDGKITDVNDATIAATGYSRSELIGSDFCNYYDDPEKAHRAYQQAFQFDVVRDYELNIRHKKGQIMPVLYNATVYRSEDGDIVGVFAAARDITEFRRIEEQRLVMSKLESTGILAGGIAHDFNNLLAAMVGNLEMARSLAVPHGEIEEHLAAAEKAAWDARSLTQQLITLAKGGAALRKPISLSGLLKEQVALTLRGSSVNSEISVPSDLWRVEVDEGQIGQVIRNLVLNAREAMPAGGMVRVTAENQVFNGETDISLPDGNYVTVSITDQGGGIAEEILQNIFDPYFSTKQRGVEKGMELGLTICQSIILKHGGMIRVSSKAGVGATFFIYLPASDKPVLEEKRKAPAVQSGGGRILLMDDEEGLRNLYAAALKKSGYDVSLAGNGEAAIDLYKEAMAQGRPFDAVILDLTVRGGMGGLDAIRSLLVVDPDVRAVISSGYADEPAMMDHERHGFKGVLAKPFGIAELREVLSHVRKQRDMTHE